MLGTLLQLDDEKRKEQEAQRKRDTKKPAQYPGFAETGIDEATWRSQQPEIDNRSKLSKLWDTVNIGDSGRSWNTKTPDKNKSVIDSVGDVATGLFSGTEKTLDAVEALTGITQRKQDARDKKYNSDINDINAKLDKDPNNKDLQAKKKKIRDTYTAALQSDLEDTKWAGTEDKGVGDRVKKAAGVSAQAVSEWIPVGKGAQAGRLAEKSAAKGTAGLSRMAKAKLAAKVGGQQAVVGAVGGAGGAAAEDGVTIKDVAKQALTGGLVSGTLGAAGTTIPSFGRKTPTEGRMPVETIAPTDAAPEAMNGIAPTAIESPTVSAPVATPTERVTQALAAVEGNDSVTLEAPIVINRTGGGKIAEAAVEPPTVETLSATVQKAPAVEGAEPSVQLKVLDDVQREADARTPGGETVPHNQVAETKTQKGAQYLVDDLEKLQKDTGIDVEALDREVAAKLTGETRRSNFQEFKDKMGRNFQDTLTYAARSLGKTGTDFVYDMLQGNKFKRDALTSLREDMAYISKLNKKLSGSSLASRRDVGARIGQALDDRANVDQYLTKPEERELFDRYVKIFDYIKILREKSGLETLENYRPWVNMKEAAEPPTWLAENVTNKRTQTLSRFSKERTRTEVDDKVDNNLADMIYGYVNSQLNELAYDAPVRKFKGNIDGMTAGNRAGVAEMNEGLDYMRTLVEQAVNPARKNPVERAVNKLTSNVYGSVLPFNVRLAIQNKTQKFVANSRVSKGARSMAKKISEADAKELEKGLIFGDTTVYGQLEDVNPIPTGKGKAVLEKVKKVDPYQVSEHNNVISSYHKGAMQAVKDSEAYKAAKANGMKTEDAIHAALQDPAVKEAAIRRGNVVVNDTQFGASPLARPEMLREEGSIWGVLPKKTIYMFTRFPIGMSQHALEVLDSKGTRALEMLKNGDPRTVPIVEMRTNYRALLESMKDSKKALDAGSDIGIPKEVLSEQIKVVSKNLKTIDKEIKKTSQIRSGKTVKNLAKMWAAAAAIQIVFDGGIQSFADDPAGTTAEAVGKTNPTMSNRVVGEYSPLAAITSSASPLDRYGNVNERAITNYIPGVGLAVNRGRDIQKIVESLTGASQDQ